MNSAVFVIKWKKQKKNRLRPSSWKIWRQKWWSAFNWQPDLRHVQRPRWRQWVWLKGQIMSYNHCKNACRGSFFKISMLSSTLSPGMTLFPWRRASQESKLVIFCTKKTSECPVDWKIARLLYSVSWGMSRACLHRRSEFPLMGYQWPCPPEWLEVWRFVLLWRGFCSLQSCHWHPKHLCFPGPSVMHVNTSLHFTFWAGILLGLVACWKWPGYKQQSLPRWAFLSCQHVVWVYCADFFPLEGSCLPFHYHFSHWMWVSEFLTLVLNAIVEFIKLNARTVAHFDSVSLHQALRFDIYIHVYFLRNFWSRLCQVGLTWPWECRHQAGLKTYAPARTWRHSTPPGLKRGVLQTSGFSPWG